MSADNDTGPTAEAGLFQTSWDSHNQYAPLADLFTDYKDHPNGFLDIFKQGVTSTTADLKTWGTGTGAEFQKLSKECPDFAAEYAALGLRHIRGHWGPINSHAAELRPEADRMFLRVQNLVDTLGLSEQLLAGT